MGFRSKLLQILVKKQRIQIDISYTQLVCRMIAARHSAFTQVFEPLRGVQGTVWLRLRKQLHSLERALVLHFIPQRPGPIYPHS